MAERDNIYKTSIQLCTSPKNVRFQKNAIFINFFLKNFIPKLKFLLKILKWTYILELFEIEFGFWICYKCVQ